jgi:hypothetical protein
MFSETMRYVLTVAAVVIVLCTGVLWLTPPSGVLWNVVDFGCILAVTWTLMALVAAVGSRDARRAARPHPASALKGRR